MNTVLPYISIPLFIVFVAAAVIGPIYRQLARENFGAGREGRRRQRSFQWRCGAAVKCFFLTVLVRTFGELSLVPIYYSWGAAIVLLLAGFAFCYAAYSRWNDPYAD